MYGKMQESGIIEIFPFTCISAPDGASILNFYRGILLFLEFL